MAGIRMTGVFFMGCFAGFGLALLLCLTRLHDPMTLLPINSINAFLTGLVLVTLGISGGIAAARAGKTLRLRTTVVAVAILAILMGVVVGVQRRSKEFWGLALQHRVEAAALSARYQLGRLDPRVTKQQMAGLSMLSQWHTRTAERFDRAANYPWLPLEPGPPTPQ